MLKRNKKMAMKKKNYAKGGRAMKSKGGAMGGKRMMKSKGGAMVTLALGL